MTRTIRGIRDSIPGGTLIGRAKSGSGPAEPVDLSAVAAAIAALQRGKAALNSTGAILKANPVQQDFVPAGGTTGQVLTKASGTDFDADWEDAASGSGDVVGPASAVTNHVAFFDGTTGKLIKDSGVTLSGSNTGDQTLPTGANPTATAADTAVNGTATTFMRSDGAPAVQKGSSTAFGIVKVDGTTITATGGVISSVSGGSGTVTTTGLPASGNLSKFSGATSITNADLTGDITTSGALATTLATVNSNVGTFGDATHVAQVTVNAKGLVTGVSSVAITGARSVTTIVTSGSATTISFTSISGAFSIATIYLNGRSQAAVTADSYLITLNSDTSAHYNSQRMVVSSTTVTATNTNLGTAFNLGGLPGASGTATYAGQAEIRFTNYAATVFAKTVSVVGADAFNDSSHTELRNGGGLWTSNAAITRIDITLNSGSAFVDGTTAILELK